MGQKWRSRPLSRVLSWTTIPLDLASPQGSSSTPGDGPSQPIVPLFGLAPSGVYRAVRRWPRTRWALTPPFHPYHARSPYLDDLNDAACAASLSPRGATAVRRSVLCCTGRRLAPPRSYLALCSVEPGLSSAQASCDAVVLTDSAVAIVAQRVACRIFSARGIAAETIIPLRIEIFS